MCVRVCVVCVRVVYVGACARVHARVRGRAPTLSNTGILPLFPLWPPFCLLCGRAPLLPLLPIHALSAQLPSLLCLCYSLHLWLCYSLWLWLRYSLRLVHLLLLAFVLGGLGCFSLCSSLCRLLVLLHRLPGIGGIGVSAGTALPRTSLFRTAQTCVTCRQAASPRVIQHMNERVASAWVMQSMNVWAQPG